MPASSHPSRANLQEEIRALLPRLSTSQARVLGEMTYAMLMVDSSGMTRICSYMAELTGQPMNTLRQKYREMYYEKEAKAGVKKRGNKRREMVVEEHFADLLRGVMKGWDGEHTLVLAMDASALSDRLSILSFSVVYRGCAIRVAWTITAGNQEGEWRPHWERMLRLLGTAVPAGWRVYVMADRGLYAPWVFRAIQANGWHPFLRVKKGMSFRQEGHASFGTVGERVKRTGQEWKGRGEWSETGEQMQGTLLVCWEEGYEEPIAVVTDLEPRQAKTAWYQLRFWIECEYKDGKRGWLHWEHTKMLKPERAGRLWLVQALVLRRAILLGGALEAQEQQRRAKKRVGRPALLVTRPRGREQSVLMRGMMAFRAAQSGGGTALPAGQIRAEPLPMRLYPVTRTCKSHQLKARRKEARKRNRRQGQRQEKREQRAAVRAAAQAAKEAARQARQQEKQERRAAKEQEKQERRAAKEAARGGSQETRSDGGASREPRLRLVHGRLQPPQKRIHPKSDPWSRLRPETDIGPPGGALGDVPLSREPQLRLFHGRLQPPQRLVHTKIHTIEGDGPPCGASP